MSHSTPSDSDIQKAVEKISGDPTIDLEELSLKKCLRMVASHLGCSVDDLQSKRDVLKRALDKEVGKKTGTGTSDDDSLPTEEEIKEAAKELTYKVDMETTSFKKFIKMLADDLDVEDLTPVKPLIKKVYDAAKDDSDATPELPSDDKIVRAAKKLAFSSRVELEEISKAKFLRMLQKKMGGIDLSPKKKLVAETLKECKIDHSKNNASLHVEDLNDKPQKVVDDSFASSTMSNTENRHCGTEEIMMLSAFNNVTPSPTKDPVLPKKSNPRCSLDLEQGRNIQQAAGLKWQDDFFDDDTDELVGVFDHDYSSMINYEMKIIILSKILPVAAMLIALMIIFGSTDVLFMLLIAIEIVWIGITIFGHYRIITSTIRAYHVAILRDGIRVVHDDHIASKFGLLGAFRCLDSCLLVSKQSETIPFDQLTKLTVKSPGEVNRDLCCWWCCAACLKIPYFTVALDTGSSNPYYYEACMNGLLEPQKFEKVAWAMKRENYEHVHKETHKILKDNHNVALQSQMNMEQMMMFNTMMKYGVAPGMQRQQQPLQQVNQPQRPGVSSTAPTSGSNSVSSSARSPVSDGRAPGGFVNGFMFPPTTY